MEKEYRYFKTPVKRSDNGSRRVEGTAIVFDKPSVYMGFTETIDRNAVDEDLIKNSDVFAYLDHNDNRGVLARSENGEGTLELWIEDDGLHYAFEAPKTQLGDELLSYLDRGEIKSSSFAFTWADDGGDTWERGADGEVYHRVHKIDHLYDVSPVFQPAYKQTDCSRRSMNEFLIVEKLDKMIDDIDKL